MIDTNGLKTVRVRLIPGDTVAAAAPIKTAEDAVKLLSTELCQYDREAFCLLNLNSKGIPLNASIVSIGELTSSLVHPREVFKSAILSSSAAVMLLHNHPSGDPTPSAEDIAITKRLVTVGKILGIPVIDHIIIGEPGRNYCMRADMDVNSENGLVFDRLLEIDTPQKEDMSDMVIKRVVNGQLSEIPLTRGEVTAAFIYQEKLWDVGYVNNAFSEIMLSSAKSADFYSEYGLPVSEVINDNGLIESIAAEMRRIADKHGYADSDAFNIAVKTTIQQHSQKRMHETKRSRKVR